MPVPSTDPPPAAAAAGGAVSSVYAIADAYVDRFAALDPIAATSLGVGGHDAAMTDYSPDGAAALADLGRATLADLRAAPLTGERDRVARDVMRERLELQEELREAGEHLRDLNIIASPMQQIRGAFDLMPRTTAEDWATIAARLRRVPEGVMGLEAALKSGLARGLVASQRQARACAAQARRWGGAGEGPSFFASLLEAYDASGAGSPTLRRDLAAAVALAARAYAALAKFFEEIYLPRAAVADGVGRDRYALAARAFSGAALDLDETYRWGWEEVRRILAEMETTAARVRPGASVAEAIEALEADPAQRIEGEGPFRAWMQALQDRTIAEMQGRHFEIPEPVRRVEAMIAPPGGALAMYYTGPSEDFSRPGRTWYPTGGRTSFPTWREVSVAYHEGVPGHHLQIGYTVYQRDRLSRYQRLLAGTSGYVEGWALYAERLMAELGYLEDAGPYMGYLSSQMLRAVRVVVDIGLHLGLPLPGDAPDHPGEAWTPEIALAMLFERTGFPREMLASEVDRYLGWPGQAISYKVGERVWLDARAQARAAQGDAFNLRAFHDRALRLGPMGLDQMRREMTAPA